jgi:hypothetical protein
MFFFSHSGVWSPNWVHSAPRPFTDLPQRHFVHHKSHLTRPGIEPGPPRGEASLVGGWGPNWVHSAPRPFTVPFCLPRVIVRMTAWAMARPFDVLIYNKYFHVSESIICNRCSYFWDLVTHWQRTTAFIYNFCSSVSVNSGRKCLWWLHHSILMSYYFRLSPSPAPHLVIMPAMNVTPL